VLQLVGLVALHLAVQGISLVGDLFFAIEQQAVDMA
jgi:hypothetical protein